jgi:DNA-binding NarL/FixJ family response regulator
MIQSEKGRQLRNQYAREFRQRNPDKVRQYNVTYWEKKAAGYTIEDQDMPATPLENVQNSRPKRINEKAIIEAKDLYSKGLTQRQIAERLNISLGTANNYLNMNSR